jgi:hypothetical protein
LNGGEYAPAIPIPGNSPASLASMAARDLYKLTKKIEIWASSSLMNTFPHY